MISFRFSTLCSCPDRFICAQRQSWPAAKRISADAKGVFPQTDEVNSGFVFQTDRAGYTAAEFFLVSEPIQRKPRIS